MDDYSLQQDDSEHEEWKKQIDGLRTLKKVARVGEWKQLIGRGIKKVDIERFKQWMEHPRIEDFIDWKNDATSHGRTMLLCSIAHERWDIAELLLDHGVDVNVADKNGETALMYVTKRGHSKIAQLLLKKGADVNVADKKGYTALMHASRFGHTDIMELLLENRGDITIANKMGDTALMLASGGMYTETVKILMKKGANVNTVNKDGDTALMLALKKGLALLTKGWISKLSDTSHSNAQLAAMVELLLNSGADVPIANKEGDTSLILASTSGHSSIVALLFERGAGINIANKTRITALMIASREGHTEIVKLLLDKGADFTITNEYGDTALMIACYHGHTEIMLLLLEKGADINIANEHGSTALMYASFEGHAKMVSLLIEKGVNITIANKYGWTALMYASTNGHNVIVQLLVGKGADLNISNKDGWTALMCASNGGYGDTVQLLLDKGAEIDVVNKDGDTALLLASREGHNSNPEELKLLSNKSVLMKACGGMGWVSKASSHTKVMELLLNKGADVTIANKDGSTALSVAADSGRAGKVKLLLYKGADINVVDNSGNSALSLAFRKGHTHIMELLSERGADSNVCNKNGQTLLHEACLENDISFAKTLLQLGTDKDRIDDNGHTALFYVAEKGSVEIVELLLTRNAVVDKTDERRLLERKEEYSGEVVHYYSVKDGRTPLFVAAQKGHHDIVALLLQHGADPYLCNHKNQTPRDVSAAYPPIQQLFRIHDFFDQREQRYAYTTEYITCRKEGWNCYEEKKPVPPLEDIIHDTVEYPHFANKFSELYQENREIVSWLDKDGRTVQQMACRECREVILFLGQYGLDEQPIYESPTCRIYNALDYGGRSEQPKRVAMKFIVRKEHFENEMRARRKGDESSRFSSEFVIPHRAAYRADQDEEYAKACRSWKASGSETGLLPDFCVVMEQGERSLLAAMNAENLLAENKDLQRREILLTLCKIFSYLHGMGYVHGDIKPHNVVRHMDENVTWKAIDFDACTKIGDGVGLKLTTGSAPPEMLKIVKKEDIQNPESTAESKVIIRQPGSDLPESDLVLADPSFDVWSYGILMYQLVTGRSFFHCDLQGNVDDAGLQELANLTQSDIHKKLEGVEDSNARVLLKSILLLDPSQRPKMSKIEQDPYFDPFCTKPEDGPSTFEYASTDQNIPKNVTKLIIGENLEEIAQGACSGNDRLKKIDMIKAHSLEIVGEEAFEGCSALEEFQCPPSVKAIGLDSFHECVKLRDFTFSEALVLSSIGDRAFYGCRALTTFKCPSNVKVIGKHAFHGCQSLRDVNLSEAHALESIEGKAFSSCAAVQKVSIPENVTIVGEGFFDGCDALESLVIAGKNPILHINVLLRLPEGKKSLISINSIVDMYSNNPVKKSELSGVSSEVDFLLGEVKEGYVESIKRSDDPIRKISKRDGWVEFLSAHGHDEKEDCIQKLISFLDGEAKIGIVRTLADATDRLGRVAKMIAPEHIRKVFEKRLFFLGRYDIANGPPIHKSGNCIVLKATDAQMSEHYKERFEECAEGMDTVDEDKFTEIVQKMKLIPYDEKNCRALFHKVDVDNNGTVSKDEFVDFCMAELGCDVVLKFMQNKDQYRRELNGRDGLDARYVVGCIRKHDTSTDADLIESLQDTMQSQEHVGETFEKNDDVKMNDYCYVLVMPFGDRNLATISQSERPGPLAVRKMMQEVGEALRHLHEKGIVHGDLKMLNVVRSNGRLSLIDLDASGRKGMDFMGSKFSSGVVPPEMIYKLKNIKELDDYKNYVAKGGGSEGEKDKRKADVVGRQCFVVRSFWEKEFLEVTNDEWTQEGKLTTLKSVPIFDGLPYSEVRNHPSLCGKDGDEGNDVLVRAAPSFDVWSFGVLLYRLLTRDPLFHVNDEDDIKNGDEMKRLYDWSDSDLDSTIERHVVDRHAKHLLKKILRSDPTERLTMAEVLNDDYFKPDLVKNMSDVHERLSTIEKISLDNRQVMRREFARVHNSLQQIQLFQAEANKLLHDVLRLEKVPRYFVILPKPDITGSSKTMTCKWFLDKVKGVTNPDTYINQPARLCFICPLSLQPVVDASGQAVGFDIEVPQDWVKDYGPALLIGMKVAQVAMSVGRCFGLPLPSLSGAEEAFAERSEVLSKLQEMVVSGLGKKGKDEEGGTIVDALVSGLTDQLEKSVSSDLEISMKIRDRLKESYSGIEKLIPADKDISDCGLIEASYVNPEKPESHTSEYVHPEWKYVFETLGSQSFEMSLEELEMEKAKLDASSTAPGATEKPSLDATTLYQSSTSPVYYPDEVAEEVSMTDSNIPELSNRSRDDRLYGKLEKMERKLDKMDDIEYMLEHKLDKLLQNQQDTSPVSAKVEKNALIFEGWLSKQSREHSWYRWQDRYFEIYANGDVAYHPKGATPDDERFVVKLYQKVKWSKMVGDDGKLELRSPKNCVLGTVKHSRKGTDSTIDEWLEKGNSWTRSSSSGFGRERKSPSKPRPTGARATTTGGISTLYV